MSEKRAAAVPPREPKPERRRSTALWFALARVQYGLRRFRAAQRTYEKILRVNPDHPEASFALARVYLKQYDADSATELIRRVRHLSGQKPRINRFIARALLKAGEYDDALQHAETAHASRPSASTRDMLALLRGNLSVYRDERLPTLEPAPNYAPLRGTILHVLENSLPHKKSGYTYRSHYVLREQQRMGLRPLGVTRAGFPSHLRVTGFPDREEVDGIAYHRVDLPGYLSHGKCPMDRYLEHHAGRVRSLSLRLQPEILHAASNFKNGLSAAAAASSLGIPWVYEMRGVWEESAVANGRITADSALYGYQRRMETLCLERADAVVTLSQTMKREIAGRGIDPQKIFLVPNAVDVDRFRAVDRDRKLADALDLGDAPVIGYISSFTRYEGIDVLVRAFARVLARVPAAKLLLVGDGKTTGALKELVRELGIGESVVMPGRVDHQAVPAYYSLIDLFVVPRIRSRVCEIVTPLKPYEAMSAGRVVLVSDLDALKEMVIPGETGATFRAGDDEDLARLCVELLSDPERRAGIARRAAKWSRENRTWSRVCGAYLEAYEFVRGRAASRKRALV